MIALRRIAAYFADYGVILLWIGVIFAGAMTGLIGFHSPEVWSPADRWVAQGQAFLMVTLPVVLYFTVSEAFGRKATIGKRLLGLQIEGTLPHVILRNVVKFLPWELAHFAIWHTMDVPMASEPSSVGLGLMTLSTGLGALYVLSLFIGTGRTPYDRISGTRVLKTPVKTR